MDEPHLLDSDQLMSVMNWLEYLQENKYTLEDVINGLRDGSLTTSIPQPN